VHKNHLAFDENEKSVEALKEQLKRLGLEHGGGIFVSSFIFSIYFILTIVILPFFLLYEYELLFYVLLHLILFSVDVIPEAIIEQFLEVQERVKEALNAEPQVKSLNRYHVSNCCNIMCIDIQSVIISNEVEAAPKEMKSMLKRTHWSNRAVRLNSGLTEDVVIAPRKL